MFNEIRTPAASNAFFIAFSVRPFFRFSRTLLQRLQYQRRRRRRRQHENDQERAADKPGARDSACNAENAFERRRSAQE